MSRIRITAAEANDNAYDVIIEAGSLKSAARLIKDVVRTHRYFVIADDMVAPLYGRTIIDGFGGDATLLTFPAGEANKTLATWQALTEQMMQHGAGRDSCVIALGGGVVGDVAGFVAATYMRGLPVIQLPTSLVAMIDSSIGGKTGVDTPYGKNLVGAFHQPRLVLVDPTVLNTLPDDQLRSGLAEAIKHGAISDADYLRWIDESVEKIAQRCIPELTRLIHGSVEIKASFVNADVHEAGARAALNFGHTIGHAIERVSEYTISHGDAVAIGMCIESRSGELAGLTSEGTTAELGRIIERAGLPAGVPKGMLLDAVLERTRSDKKSRRGRSRYTLLSGIGEIARTSEGEWTHELEDDIVRQALGV